MTREQGQCIGFKVVPAKPALRRSSRRNPASVCRLGTLKMGNALRKIELVEQLLQKSVTGTAVRIPFDQDIMLARMHVAGTYYYEAAASLDRPGRR